MRRAAQGEFDDIVVGGESSDVGVYRSPVPEIRITSVDLDTLGQVSHDPTLAFLEAMVQALRGVADDCYGEGRHKTVIRTATAPEAISVARPEDDAWALATFIQDDAGDLRGIIDLSPHPDIRDFVKTRKPTTISRLLEQTAAFVVRSAQYLYLETFESQQPVKLVADMVAAWGYFWSTVALDKVLPADATGDDGPTVTVSFVFNLIKHADLSRPRTIAVSVDVWRAFDGRSSKERIGAATGPGVVEFLPREAFHHTIICRSRRDHMSMEFELFPRRDLDIDDDGNVIGPDGLRYSIDVPGVMSHLRI